MRLYGLIGYPLSHSFSQKFFTEKFEKEGLQDCRYEVFPISSIERINDVLTEPDLCGLNVTIPYKQQVIQLLTDADSVVTETGACNCIVINDQVLKGYNTDVIGFQRSLTEKLQSHHTHALILGTGGASKAVAYVLDKMKIAFHYVSRTPSVGQYAYDRLTREVIENHKLIINTTPVGMYPGIENAPPIPFDYIGKKHYLFDLVYNPEKTVFLSKGEEKGATIKNGYEMLVIQAEESWRIWNQG